VIFKHAFINFVNYNLNVYKRYATVRTVPSSIALEGWSTGMEQSVVCSEPWRDAHEPSRFHLCKKFIKRRHNVGPSVCIFYLQNYSMGWMLLAFNSHASLKEHVTCKILGFHSDDYEECRLLQSATTRWRWFHAREFFYPTGGGDTFLRTKRRLTHDLHSATSQKTTFFNT
jgi:hypothetical protein